MSHRHLPAVALFLLAAACGPAPEPSSPEPVAAPAPAEHEQAPVATDGSDAYASAPGREPEAQAEPGSGAGTGTEAQLLPDDFSVWVLGGSVVNHGPAGEKRVLPTNNAYKAAPGCYVACYSRDRQGAVYEVGGGIVVKGQFRTAGRYTGRVCQPQGWEGKDISAAASFKARCTELVPTCQGDCWAGGDTGGWLGVQ